LNFIQPLLGGLMIGIAALLMLAGTGRIMGISGITWSAVSLAADRAWRWCFLVGIVLGAGLFHWLSGQATPEPNPAAWVWIVTAGLLVGFGTRLGSGCTSGHGVCGLGRLSKRSLVATLTFMSSGIVTVFILRHLIGGYQ